MCRIRIWSVQEWAMKKKWKINNDRNGKLLRSIDSKDLVCVPICMRDKYRLLTEYSLCVCLRFLWRSIILSLPLSLSMCFYCLFVRYLRVFVCTFLCIPLYVSGALEHLSAIWTRFYTPLFHFLVFVYSSIIHAINYNVLYIFYTCE